MFLHQLALWYRALGLLCWRTWARVTIYDEEERILRWVKPRNWVDGAGEVN